MQRTSPVDRRANENLKVGFSGELPETILLPAPIDSPFSGRHQASPQTYLSAGDWPRVWMDTPYPLKLSLLHPTSPFFPNDILYCTG